MMEFELTECCNCGNSITHMQAECSCGMCQECFASDSEENYAQTDIKDPCEQCNSKDTVTYVKRVYIPTAIEDEGMINEIEMPYLQYKQVCSDCGHEHIYHLQ